MEKFMWIKKEDAEIPKWPNGKHFYIKMNGTDINGYVKYNTIEEAEKEKNKYLRKIRFKKW